MNLKSNLLILLALPLSIGTVFSQSDSTKSPSKAKQYYQWSHSDIDEDGLVGISLAKALQFAEEHQRTPKNVIVAIIDSGVDTAQEDLINKLWVNPGEIPGNGVDDDGNGYIDDIHGWNFIGGKDGKNVDGDTWELTRLYRKYKKQFADKSASEIASDEKAEYKEWLKIEKEFKKQRSEARERVKLYKAYIDAINSSNEILDQYFRGQEYDIDDVNEIHTTNKKVSWAVNVYQIFQGDTKGIESSLEYYKTLLNQKLNTRFYSRQIVGDNPEDITDSIYGNNDVTAGTSSHGTGVAGIVAADSHNGFGINGIADSVRIMIVRVVPGGDERDKDVALGIRYAVNQGAQIINCSFGKSYSPHKEFVDSAIRYAERHNVLIIHAAGNDAADNDKVPHYPSPEYAPGKFVSNWIDVGASDSLLNLKLPAGFSNYGRHTVDLFAPGVDIRSTAPKNKYRKTSGTSDAAPVVTGVAALVLSYYPNLTAVQLRDIIVNSSRKYGKQKVYYPSDGKRKKKTRFGKLSKTGGVVNAYEAMKMAEDFSSGQ